MNLRQFINAPPAGENQLKKPIIGVSKMAQVVLESLLLLAVTASVGAITAFWNEKAREAYDRKKNKHKR